MKKLLVIGMAILLVLSLGLNLYAWHSGALFSNEQTPLAIDSDQKIKEIESYIDSISLSYIADEKKLAAQYDVTSMGCGPSSYALARIINKKFFDDQLSIGAVYNKNEPYQIVERFSFAQSNGKTGDHAWLEIYFKDRFLFIDPTTAQFGGEDAIAHEVFAVGDPKLQATLNTKYHIDDIRLRLLVNKVIIVSQLNSLRTQV